MKYILFFILISLSIQGKTQINLEVVGRWDYDIPFLDILEAGNDFSGAYESSLTQVNLSITKGILQNFNWKIDVRKGNEDWHPDLRILVKRTGDGVGGLGSHIEGGTNYQEISELNQFFFQGQKSHTLIPFQYKVENVSVTIPAKTYYTTIVYTVTEL